MKTRTWIILIAAFTLTALAASAWILMSRKSSGVAQVLADGELVRTIDLASVKEAYTFEVTTEKGTNVILVEPGRICVKDADCKDHTCVKMGWLQDQATPIVCLPHKLVIRIVDADGPDAVVQ